MATWLVLPVQAIVLVNSFWHVCAAGVLLQRYAAGLLGGRAESAVSICLFVQADRETVVFTPCHHRSHSVTTCAHAFLLIGLMRRLMLFPSRA